MFKRIVYGCLILGLVIFLWPLVSHNPFAEKRMGAEWNHRLKLMTLNTHQMDQSKAAGENKVIQFLQQSDADIICLEEVEVHKNKGSLTLDGLKTAMKDWPYTYIDFKIYNKRRQYGNVVFSRYPLINKETIPFVSKGNISSQCDVVVDGDTLRLIVNHLESNRLANLQNGDSVRSDFFARLKGRLNDAGVIRHEQARIVKRAAYASPYPVMMVGDFNDMPWSYTYRHLKQGMRDAFLSGSIGHVGNTYVRHGIGIRIDYILVSRKLHGFGTMPIKTDVSDHYPVVSTIVWN